MNSATKLAEPITPRPDERRWVALAFIALAQLMAALDATIVSIALPWAQRALGASDAERQWIITAYTLAFGGLLLVGGRIADALGRKRTFLIGLAGFALASALGGSAGTFAMLLVARAAQGAFAALLAPTALSLLAVTFTEPRERARAFALYGAIAGSGAAIGLLLGGILTQYLNWRWCLYVNVPIAMVAAVGGWRFLSGARGGSGQSVVNLSSGASVCPGKDWPVTSQKCQNVRYTATTVPSAAVPAARTHAATNARNGMDVVLAPAPMAPATTGRNANTVPKLRPSRWR